MPSQEETENTPVKPGYKTTEFWLSFAACIVGTLAASGVFPDESTGMKIVGLAMTTLAALGYTTARFMTKK
jgi:hypothetical protein